MQERLKREQEEKEHKKKEKAEAHLYTIIKVTTYIDIFSVEVVMGKRFLPFLVCVFWF